MSQELHYSLMGKQALNTRITTPAHTTSGLQKIPADAEPDEPLRPRGTWLERLGAAPWWFTKYSAGQELAEPKYHCAIAGLAALAFLGAGHTSKVGKYKDHVRHALEYLQSQQDEHGCFGPVKGPGQGHYIYDQAICTLPLAEAGAMTREAAWRDSAQKDIRFLEDFQSEYAGWRYYRKDGDADVSVIGWVIMACTSAKVAGLHVDPACFEGALAFVDKVTRMRGEGSEAVAEVFYRPGEDFSSGFETNSFSTTSIGTLVRMYCGGKPSDPQIAGGCVHLQNRLPAWDKKHFYYWYYGTLTTFQQGGELWKNWNEAMKKTLVENQCQGGDEDGSWDPAHDYYGHWFGGRVYSTALGALCLEVYYRYLPLYR